MVCRLAGGGQGIYSHGFCKSSAQHIGYEPSRTMSQGQGRRIVQNRVIFRPKKATPANRLARCWCGCMTLFAAASRAWRETAKPCRPRPSLCTRFENDLLSSGLPGQTMRGRETGAPRLLFGLGGRVEYTSPVSSFPMRGRLRVRQGKSGRSGEQWQVVSTWRGP